MAPSRLLHGFFATPRGLLRGHKGEKKEMRWRRNGTRQEEESRDWCMFLLPSLSLSHGNWTWSRSFHIKKIVIWIFYLICWFSFAAKLPTLSKNFEAWTPFEVLLTDQVEKRLSSIESRKCKSRYSSYKVMYFIVLLEWFRRILNNFPWNYDFHFSYNYNLSVFIVIVGNFRNGFLNLLYCDR